MGHSAGAYNAAMLALDAQWLGGAGLDRHDLHSTIGLAGPYDFLPLHTDELRTIFGPQDQLARTNRLISSMARHRLCCCSPGPRTPRSIRATRCDWPRASERPRGEVEDKIYPGIQHEEIVGSLGVPLRFLAPTLQDCVAFMRSGAAPPAEPSA